MKTDGSNAFEKTKERQKGGTLGEWLALRKGKFNEVIPLQTLNLDRFLQSAIREITNPKVPLLRQCTKESIERSLIEAASYGLELGGVLGQAYLIPYNESFPNGRGGWEKKITCHFQMGYKGLIALARRSKTIKTIAAEPVYENDHFEVQLGCGRKLSHTMDLMKERGKIIGYYCLVELENEGIQFAVMSKKDVQRHRDQFSKGYKEEDKENNWNKNFDAMALKTCVIKALKLCPISVEALEAVRKEEISEVAPEELREVTGNVAFIQDETPPQIEAPKGEPSQIPQGGAQTEKLANQAMELTPEEEAEIDAAWENGRTAEAGTPDELF